MIDLLTAEERKARAKVWRQRWVDKNPERAAQGKRESDRRRYERYKATRVRKRVLLPAETRFLDGLRPQANGCVYWGEGRTDLYGCLKVDGQMMKAHRFSWLFYRGPLTDQDYVLHACDTPKCVAPDHLFLGTKADNSRDMMAKGRGKGQWTRQS